eukprot:2473077-Rhodomonas_salina.3
MIASLGRTACTPREFSCSPPRSRIISEGNSHPVTQALLDSASTCHTQTQTQTQKSYVSLSTDSTGNFRKPS